VGYYTRVLSKQEEFPSFEELALLIQAEHPEYKLTIEEGSEEEWESLLLSGKDEVEVALLERNPVTDGSLGQDAVAEFLEDTQDCKPVSGVQWLAEYLAEGFTNEDGYQIVWQFSDSVSGPWNMGVLQDGIWHHFEMDLGDPDHRVAFLKGRVPHDLSDTLASGSVD